MFSDKLMLEIRRRFDAGEDFAVYCLPGGEPVLCHAGQIELTPWPGCALSPEPWRESTRRDDYLADLTRLIENLRRDGGKTVVSRTVCGEWGEVDPLETASQLFADFPRCYRTLIYTREAGGWMGASPELLYRLDGRRLSTMALAGTLPDDGTPWDAKNLAEHAMVADHVDDCLRRCFDNGLRHSLATLGYGRLRHLYTPFEATVTDTDSLTRFSTMMHPTPAVGGSPRDRALQQIADIERHPRRLYAGLVTLRPDADSRLSIVNLRCLHFDRRRYCVYAGGGITADSDPATEWRETAAKASWFTDRLQPPPTHSARPTVH